MCGPYDSSKVQAKAKWNRLPRPQPWKEERMPVKRLNHVGASFPVNANVIEVSVSGPELDQVQAIWAELTASIQIIQTEHQIGT